MLSRRRTSFLLLLFTVLSFVLLSTVVVHAATSVKSHNFTFTDSYGKQKSFHGNSGTVTMIIGGGIGTCGNTNGVLSVTNASLEGIEEGQLLVYAFDIKSNSDSTIASYMTEQGFSDKIMTGSSTNSSIRSLLTTCYSYSRTGNTMPFVYFVDKDGNIVDYCEGGGASAQIQTKLENLGIVINKVGNADITYSNVDLEVTFGQTEARKQLAMMNSFRTGSEAWFWNSDNTTKTTRSGLGTLTYDYDLEKVAMLRAVEIAYSYSHTRPNGLSCSSAYDGIYSSSVRGENIAYGYTSSQEVFKAWKEDDEDYAGQGHRRNMLNTNYTTFAVGHVTYNGVQFWVQLFGNNKQNTNTTIANDGNATYTINVCSAIKPNDFSNGVDSSGDDEVEHNWMVVSTTVTKCEESSRGLCTVEQQLRCTNCGMSAMMTRTGNHKFVSQITKEASCGENGSKSFTCQYCSYQYEQVIRATNEHVFDEGTVTKEATRDQDGEKTYTCTVCGNKKTEPIHRLKSISLKSVSVDTGSKVYTGKAIKPALIVKDENNNIVDSSNYTVKYKNNTKVGKATIAVSACGDYSGTVKTTFKIVPKATGIKTIKAGSKSLKVSWKKISTQTSGYQIQYAGNARFTDGKTVSVAKNTTSTKTIKGLKGKKKYYVRVRTYTKIGKTYYYSAWSKVKTVISKK